MTSPLQDAIDKLLRNQNTQANMVETLWLLYARSVGVPMGGTQWIESRRCFFAGAMTLFEAVLRILEPGVEPTDKDLLVMEKIATELRRFQDDLSAGRA